ncbi:hypothetical protein BEWA_021460 [Theileria equi strain WA]|uniref:Uncharacterized protein n=1 Tax=Theileria equi strain WA TaxID=1537102 RepID=L0AVM7_THEEQ|nr:hypothetical protein BEWA_021460 [Theileria equi strain WA]AFZ79298.1 hypothetical protein BEWA_021460 [Theileria equi strain WA]|eukprot:XP_004828964.1 hypothetical protein BEWA_021460 [Theileria equi strain WA]
MSDSVRLKKNLRCKVYSFASKFEYLDENGPIGRSMKEKISSTVDRLERAVKLSENLILLVLGQPYSGKSFLVKNSLRQLLGRCVKPESLTDGPSIGQTKIIELYTHDYKDDVKCMKDLLMQLESLTGAQTVKGVGHLISEMQKRMLHCLTYLKRNGIYVIIVIDGLERFTRGIYDCSSTTGSYSKRQGLLYFLGDSMQLKDTAFSLLCITSDLRTSDRFEKRVKSRFVHETIYCHNDADIQSYFDENLTSKNLVPGCNVGINKDNMVEMNQESLCGTDFSFFVNTASIACLLSNDKEFEENSTIDISENFPKKGRVRWSLDLMSIQISEDCINIFKQLSLPEHYILTSLTRLHCRGVYPQTFISIQNDLKELVHLYPQEKHAIPHQRVGLSLVFYNFIGS